MKKTLVVMVKEPHPGRVKTRLGAGIGAVPAAWWFRHQTKALLARLQDRRWDLVLAVSPDREGLNSRVWPVHLPRFPQGAGTLGDRMARVFRTLSVGPIVIIGGDIPGIQRRHIAEAFSALGDHQAVIGPATDGGYWAIGLKRVASVPHGLFEGVRWSSEHALEDTLQSIPDLTVAHLDYLQDVDTVDDLAKLSKHKG